MAVVLSCAFFFSLNHTLVSLQRVSSSVSEMLYSAASAVVMLNVMLLNVTTALLHMDSISLNCFTASARPSFSAIRKLKKCLISKTFF